MFSFSKDQVTNGLISFFMLFAMVFGSVDACLARVNSHIVCMPDDESRLVFVGAAFLGFLLAAFRTPGE
jgi:hypothetical protein